MNSPHRGAIPFGAPLVAGQKIAGRYLIEKEIGRGGMGAVYLATDEKLGERVALKIVSSTMSSDPEAASERFRREVAAARKVTHPNVIRIHDLIEDQGQLLLSMEYIDGMTLAGYLGRVGALRVEGGAPADRADLRRARHRARRRRGAPRPQAGQRADRRRTARQGDRLRARQGVVPRRDDRHRPHPRHPRVHGTGAGARPAVRRAHRPLRPRRARLPRLRRPPTLLRREPDRDRLRARQPAPAPTPPAPPRAA
ncbi:MAG: hypothetical protein EXR72_20260 [Myxococcales bacterium]|nr:hypothetical protein [Myxococcales bacterium]